MTRAARPLRGDARTRQERRAGGSRESHDAAHAGARRADHTDHTAHQTRDVTAVPRREAPPAARARRADGSWPRYAEAQASLDTPQTFSLDDQSVFTQFSAMSPSPNQSFSPMRPPATPPGAWMRSPGATSSHAEPRAAGSPDGFMTLSRAPSMLDVQPSMLTVTPAATARAAPGATPAAGAGHHGPRRPAQAGDHATDATGTPQPGHAPAAGGGADAAGGAHAGATPAGTGGPAHRRASGGDAQHAQEAPAAEPAVEAVMGTLEADALDVQHHVDVAPAVARWDAPSALGDDVLPRPDPEGRGPPARGASPRPAEREREAERMASARDHARSSWVALAAAARASEQSFVDESNRVSNALDLAYANLADRITDACSGSISELAARADETCDQIDATADGAEIALDESATATTHALQGAAARALAAIAANEASAGTQITAVLAGLVGGHRSAFDGVIANTEAAMSTALDTLTAWSAARTENFPIAGGSRLEGAQNEKRQIRAAHIVTQQIPIITERRDRKLTAWAHTRDATVCSLECGYRAPLDAHRAAMHTSGRESVNNALGSARQTLAGQVRDVRAALHGMRASATAQVRTRQRGGALQLTSTARAALQAARSETMGAVGAVGSATQGALPGYWRAASSLEQALRGAGAQGSAAIERTLKTVPDDLRRGIARTNETLHDRLQSNQSRLETSLEAHEARYLAGRREQLTQHGVAFDTLGQSISQQMDSSVQNVSQACAGLVSTVSAAATAWAQPLSVHFAEYIADKRVEARDALDRLLDGGNAAPAGAGGTDAASDGAAGGGGAGCGGCDRLASTPDAGGQSGGQSGGPAMSVEEGAPRGLLGEEQAELAFADQFTDPYAHFADPLHQAGTEVESDLGRRARDVGRALDSGIIFRGDDTATTAALRGLTPPGGAALDQEVYPSLGHGFLRDDLFNRMGGNDRNAALSYLSGDAVAGARYELEASMHWYNDQETRIQDTMAALSPEQLRALGGDRQLLNRVDDALDGTDQEVFRALRDGHYATAKAMRLRDSIDEARRDGDADALHTAIEQATTSTEGWGGDEDMSADQRRIAVVTALGGVVGDQPGVATTDASGHQRTDAEIAADRAQAYVTRDIQVYDPNTEDLETRSLTGANRDLAVALLRTGGNSIQARAARLGVEIQRSGDPSALNIDKATYDERFMPDNPHATPEERAANEERRREARSERAQVLLLAAQSYGGMRPPGDGSAAATASAVATQDADHPVINPLNNPDVTAARDRVIGLLGDRFGDDDLGRQFAAGMLTDERMSPRTTAMAMRHAMYSHVGTNEELLFRVTERMTRDEVREMRAEFRAQTGDSLDAELGTYGQGGMFSELSGDDRLRMERAMLGVARDDRERAEVAEYAIHQQRKETGSFGRWLASGSNAEEAMNATEAQLRGMAGGQTDFSAESLMSGRPLLTGGNFDRTTGRYNGDQNPDHFRAVTESAQQVAQNYSARIDDFANFASTGIMILGAIAGAVITVVTGGAAGPLVVAALATGLASMGAKYLIKSGRYGWEEAGVDLAMTAVQAVTAGVGAQLGQAAKVAAEGAEAAAEASRTVLALSRLFTGDPLVDQVMIGAVTGAIGGLGNTALQEQTWEHGAGGAFNALFEGLARGVLSGAVSAAATHGLEQLGGLGERLQKLSTEPGGMAALRAMVLRGAGKSAISATAAVAGRASEMAFDASAHPNRHFDAGEALMELGQTGLQSALQSFGEGAAEAYGASVHAARLRRAEAAVHDERARRGLPELKPEELHAAGEDLVALAPRGYDAGNTAAPPEPSTPRGSPGPDSNTHAAGAPARPAHAADAAGAEAQHAAPVRSAEPVDATPSPQPVAPAVAEPPRAATQHPTEAAEPTHATTAAAPESVREGAAAAIAGSGMRLADQPVITQPHAALQAALGEASGVGALGGKLRVDTAPTADGHVEASLSAADGTALRIKIIVADTEGGDVASFHRPGPGEEGFDYVVRLSPRAPVETHGRALAHELAELRVHAPRGTTEDALRPGRGLGDEHHPQKLSAHDHGRLAELEVLVRRANVPDQPPAQLARTQGEIEALLGHLGLLNDERLSQRLALAQGALGTESMKVVMAARSGAAGHSDADVLAPTRRFDPDAPLTLADRRQIAELEGIARQIDAADWRRRGGSASRDVSVERTSEHPRLQREMDDRLARLGVVGPLEGTPAGRRMQRVLDVLGEGSSVAARVTERQARVAGPESASAIANENALRPGLKPTAQADRTELSTTDQASLQELANRLRALDHELTTTSAPAGGDESPTVRRLRHEAEDAAAELGLVHGRFADERRTLAKTRTDLLPEALHARLAEVATGGKTNPLLLPLTATPNDVPLLLRQIRAARAMGDTELAGRLMQITGLHLAASGLGGATPAERMAAQRFMREAAGPGDRDMLADIAQRQHARVREDGLRRQIDQMENRLQRIRLSDRIDETVDGVRYVYGESAMEPARLSQMADMEDTIAHMRSAADEQGRVARRPFDMPAEDARAFAGTPEEMGAFERAHGVLAGFDTHEQARLVHQLYGDAPGFQSIARLMDVQADWWHSIDPQFAGDETGALNKTSRKVAERRESLYEAWAAGSYVSEETGHVNELDFFEFVASSAGRKIWGEGSNAADVLLAGTDKVNLRRYVPPGGLAAGVSAMEEIDVGPAITERQQRLVAHEQLVNASPRDMEAIVANMNRIKDLSEALGEAAGVRYAASLPLGTGGQVYVERGANMLDVVHVRGTLASADFCVTTIECKGGESPLGDRNARQGGRPVRAEQTTPEYLRSMALGMRSKNPDLATMILEALDRGPPAIQSVVVRQGFDVDANQAAAAAPIEVTDYPVTRNGR